MTPSTTDFRPMILIPCFNPGRRIETTVQGASGAGVPIWIIDDGSDADTRRRLADLANRFPSVTVVSHDTNRGKGAAVLTGIQAANERGFTHALTMDADGQHPAGRIPAFIEASRNQPEAMILGRPVFSDEAPALRVQGRKISNFWADLETLWGGIGDSLFGFRVYPIAPLIAVMQETRWMRRFDFDPEAAVRLIWRGVPAINVDAPVRYFDAEANGVSHFRYVRDNRLLIWMHLRLMAGFLRRLPRLTLERFRTTRRHD